MEVFHYLRTLFISCPEQLVFTITVLILIARCDLIKLTPKNVSKIAIVSVLNGIIVDILRWLCPSFVLNIVLYMIIISTTLTFILKIRWADTIIATLLTILEFFFVEMAFYAIVIGFKVLDYEVAKNSVYLSTMWSLPVRFIEIGLCIVLFHIPVAIIDLKPFNKAKGFISRFSFFVISLLFGILMIANVFQSLFFDMKLHVGGDTRNYLLTNLFFAVSLIIASIAQYIKSRNTAKREKEQYLYAMRHLSSLLQTGNDGIIKALDVIKKESDRWEGDYE